MLKKMKLNAVLFGEYLIVFASVFLAYFFIIPRTDDFIFNSVNIGNYKEIYDFIFHYGNGRILGNAFLLILSHNFILASIFISLTIVIAVFLTNKLFFEANIITPLLIATFYAFPCALYLSECYYWLPAFINYVLPIDFILIAVYFFKSACNNGSKKFFSSAIFLLFIIFSCLFSENTSVVLVMATSILFIFNIIQYKKINFKTVMFMLGAVIGTIAILAIPKLTHSEYKLSGYREYANFSIPTLFQNFISTYLLYFETILESSIIIIILSIALIFLIFKKEKTGLFRTLRISVFAIYPICSIMINSFDSDVASLKYIEALLTVVYLVNIAFSVVKIGDFIKNKNLLLFIMFVLSPSPMIVVATISYRTMYIGYFALILFTSNILRIVAEESECKYTDLFQSRELIKTVCIILSSVIICSSLYIGLQSVYNYNYYVVRTEYIKEIMYTDDDVEVIPFPCDGIYIDIGDKSTINCMFPQISKERVKTVNIQTFREKSRIYDDLPSNPILALKYALSHLEYKKAETIK